MNAVAQPVRMTALHEAARRLILFTMAGEHLRGGDGFVPVHELREITELAAQAFTPDELAAMADDVAEYAEDAFSQPVTDLAVRVVQADGRRYRWLLLRALADGGYAQHAAGDVFDCYADAFAAGTAALAAEGRTRAVRPMAASNDGKVLLPLGAA
ncbi:hypothetical protein [Ottowia sp. SB7-C50]|uniref:hypothetical protein n=1 Tax=Ottowia sp. SB7-C50 TaxID=3081231 RepID=UPI0029557629|nr:hypothetical protein [Ottowia sp. SB7-C50]WOP14582.1 hypothetical protein R0D99_12090 [Ottowia sp. SB7-C50]